MSRFVLYVLLVVGLLTTWGVSPVAAQDVPSWAKTQPRQTAPQDSPPPFMAESPGTYVLRAGDEIVVTFLGVADAPYDLKIREDGGIFVPRIGEVRAAGRTLVQLKPILETRLGKHLIHSQIEIGLKSIAPKYAMVFGEVSKPGQIAVTNGMTLMEALSEAGGMGTGADQSEVTVVRNKQTLHVMLQGNESPAILPGDVIYVQRAGKISVNGAVTAPGLVPLAGAKMTLWDALVSVGGPRPDAAMSRVHVERFGPSGTTSVPKTLDLSAGPASPDAQMIVASGDVVTVPGQRVLFVSTGAGAGSKVLPLAGPTSLLDILVEAGIGEKKTLSKVSIIRAKDVPTDMPKTEDISPDKIETIDVAAALKKGTTAQLTTVRDGDVVVVSAPTEGGGLLRWANFVPYLGLLRNL